MILLYCILIIWSSMLVDNTLDTMINANVYFKIQLIKRQLTKKSNDFIIKKTPI